MAPQSNTTAADQVQQLKSNLEHQLSHAQRLRTLSWAIIEGEHKAIEGDEFRRKDYLAFGLFTRMMQTHEAIEVVVRNSLVDDGWTLLRALVEYATNSAYMLLVADNQTADDFVDLRHHANYSQLLDLRATDQALVDEMYDHDLQEELRLKYEAVRARFDNRRGDRWCNDDRLYKRACRVDEKMSQIAGEPRTDFLFLVNSVWRHGSSYVHGSANSLAAQMKESDVGVVIQRNYTREEGAEVIFAANLAVYYALLRVDARLGGRNADRIKGQFTEWSGIAA
jgi:hypothetical protein